MVEKHDNDKNEIFVSLFRPAFQSSYQIVNGCEPTFTNLTIDFCDCLDYILFDKDCLKPIDCEAIPTKHDLFTAHKQLQAKNDASSNNNNDNNNATSSNTTPQSHTKPKRQLNKKEQQQQQQEQLFKTLSKDPIDFITFADNVYVPNRAYPS
eukprot:CAMPEP_0168584806 /NCGR_PEP_ID=MMETSP0420-20121227/3341_1 /TAXON_ID=498008 /ORGANISM="Pessonella sp." /LENGTH=151 /DNA_ID=CAMNT_0008619643 /DNA_START=802 /DNA_END=1253 /DNA_ORIENTATION=+